MLTDITEIAQRLGLRKNGSEYKRARVRSAVAWIDSISSKAIASLSSTAATGARFQAWRRAVGIEQERPLLPRRVEVVAEMPTPNARAVEAWGLTSAAQPNHLYLVRKRIKPHGHWRSGPRFQVCAKQCKRPRQFARDPLLSARTPDHTAIHSRVQQGKKAFYGGGKQTGVNFTFAGGDAVWIVEGFATGASLYEDTGDTVVVAFSASQLGNVAKWAARAYPWATSARDG